MKWDNPIDRTNATFAWHGSRVCSRWNPNWHFDLFLWFISELDSGFKTVETNRTYKVQFSGRVDDDDDDDDDDDADVFDYGRHNDDWETGGRARSLSPSNKNFLRKIEYAPPKTGINIKSASNSPDTEMLQKMLTLVESANRKPHPSQSPDQQSQKGQGHVNGPQTERYSRDRKGQGYQQGQAHTAPATNYTTQGIDMVITKIKVRHMVTIRIRVKVAILHFSVFTV